MLRTKGASGGARLPLSARFAKSKRHSQPLSAFLVAFALWGHVAGRWHSLLCASGTLHLLFTGQCQLWSLTKKEGLACKSRAVSSGKQRQVADLVRFWCSYSLWMWGSKIDLNTWTCPTVPFLTHHLFTPMLAERLCGTCIEMLAMVPMGYRCRHCTQEPEFRSEIATSSQSPYFLWKRRLPPLHLLSSHKAASGSPALYTLVHLLPVLLHWASFPCYQ